MLGNKARMSAFTILICHCTGSPIQHDKTRNRNKNIQIGKDKITLFLFTDDILSMSKIQRDLQKMLLEQINEFIKTAGYKITIQKPILF